MTLEEQFHLHVGRRPNDSELQQMLRAQEAMAVRDDSPAMALVIAQIAGMSTIAAAADQAIGRMTEVMSDKHQREMTDEIFRQAVADLSAAMMLEAGPIMREIADEATRWSKRMALARILDLVAVVVLVLLVGAAAGFAGYKAGLAQAASAAFERSAGFNLHKNITAKE